MRYVTVLIVLSGCSAGTPQTGPDDPSESTSTTELTENRTTIPESLARVALASDADVTHGPAGSTVELLTRSAPELDGAVVKMRHVGSVANANIGLSISDSVSIERDQPIQVQVPSTVENGPYLLSLETEDAVSNELPFIVSESQLARAPACCDQLPIIADGFIEHIDVVYGNPDDRYHLLDAFVPNGIPGPFPAVVIIHGGGHRSGSKDALGMGGLQHELAMRGVATFSIEYELALSGPSFPKDIQDVLCAIRYIKENAAAYDINVDRMALYGFSAGAQEAGLAAVLQGDEAILSGSNCDAASVDHRVAMVVMIAGAGDYSLVGEVRGDYRGGTANWLGVSWEEDPQTWLAASPASYLSADDPIVVAVQGDVDDKVLKWYTDEFVSQLEVAGVESHYQVIEGAGHDILVDYESDSARHARCFVEPLLADVLGLSVESICFDDQ